MKLAGLTAAILMACGASTGARLAASCSLPQGVPADIPCIEVNTATAEDFARLPGIGPKLAKRIVSFRAKHGPFRRVEDLLAIRGIGHNKWKAMRPFLRVSQEAEPAPPAPQTTRKAPQTIEAKSGKKASSAPIRERMKPGR